MVARDGEKAKTDELMRGFDEVIARASGLTDGESRHQTATALNGKAEALASLGRYDESLVCFERVIEQLDGATRHGLRAELARAWASKGAVLLRLDRFEEADSAFDAMRAPPDQVPADGPHQAPSETSVAKMFHQRVRSLFEAGGYAQTVLGADVLLKRFGDHLPPSRSDLVANVLLLKAAAVGELGRGQEAISLLGELADRYGRIEDSNVQTVVAAALNREAKLLFDYGDEARAFTAYDAVVTRFKSAVTPALRRSVTIALHGKRQLLRRTDRYEEMIAVVDELLALSGDTAGQQLGLELSLALSDKAAALEKLGRWQASIIVDDELIARFGRAKEETLKIATARALSRTARALRELGDSAQSRAVLEQVLEQYGDSELAELRGLVATATGEMAESLMLSGRFREAGALGDVMISHAGSEANPTDPALSAHGLGVKGAALAGEGFWEEAIDSFDALIARFENSPPELDLRGEVALALNNKVIALTRLGRHEESAAVHDDLVARFGAEALEVLDAHARQCENSGGPHAGEQLAASLYSKAWILRDLDRHADAKIVLDELIARFEHDEDPHMHVTVANARKARDALISR
jgi:tetratricopeptide (TPR) repeat protein